MSWKTEDVARFKKGLSAKQTKTWLEIANPEYQRCMDEGGSEEKCAARAIRIANGVLKKQAKESAMDYPFNQEIIQNAINETWNKWFGEKDTEEPAENVGETTMDKEYSEEETQLGEAKWDTAFMNDLPDSSFAVIMPGGEKDADGKTTPRSLRKLPYKDASGKVDLPHLRNALARLPQMKGVTDAQKSKALKLLQRMAAKHLKSYEGDNKKSEEAYQVAELLAEAVSMLEFDWSFENFSTKVYTAFNDLFPVEPGYDRGMYIIRIYYEHPSLGNSVIINVYKENKLYKLSYQIMNNEVEFNDNWTEVVETYIPVSDQSSTEESAQEKESDKVEMAETDPLKVTIAEYGGGGFAPLDIEAVQIAEEQADNDNPRDPIKVKVKLIKPGFGNSRDRHYYPAEVLERDAAKFAGVEMCITDHRESERSEKNKVSVIDRIVGFDNDGSPIGEVTIYDPDFAEKTRARKKAGKLHTMACSIKGEGMAKPGTVNGQKANVVTELSRIDYVDWVTKAGAGGQAVGVSESDSPKTTETQPVIETDDKPTEKTPVNEAGDDKPGEDKMDKNTQGSTTTETNVDDKTVKDDKVNDDVFMEEGAVKEALDATNLPQVSKARLAELKYKDSEALQSAIKKEAEYLKSVTSSGKVFAMGETHSVEKKPMSPEEYKKAGDNILESYGLKPY